MGEAKRKRDWRQVNREGLDKMGEELLAAKMSMLQTLTYIQFLEIYPKQAVEWLLQLSEASPAALCLTCNNEVGPPDHHFTPVVSALFAHRLDGSSPEFAVFAGVCDECCESLGSIDAVQVACYAVIKEKWMPESQPIAGAGSA